MKILDFPFGELREDVSRRNDMYRYWRVHAIIGNRKWVSSEMKTPADLCFDELAWEIEMMTRRGRAELRAITCTL